MRKYWTLTAVLLFFLLPLGAKNINFQIVQNNSGGDDVFAMSYLFEQALSDFFFESGHIVTNSAVFVKTDDEADQTELRRVLAETLLGGMDVLVRVHVNYASCGTKSPSSFTLDSIKDVSWSNYNAKTGRYVSGGSMEAGNAGSFENNESGVYSFASLVSSKISSTLKNSK